MTEVNLPLVIGASVVDSINPCAFGVLIFLLAYLARATRSKASMLLHGLAYILAVFLTYLAAGLLLLPIIQKLGSFSVAAYVIIGVVILFAGLLEIKEAVWKGEGFTLSIMPKDAARIKAYVRRVSDKYLTSFLLGVFVAIVELPCTGAVYLAVLAMMSFAGITTSHLFFLILYNIIFVLPLIIILVGVVNGMSAAAFEAWRKKHRILMRLAAGALLIVMGVWMIGYILL
ncbi:hypothetical protein HYU19_04380 [Candidatus Woesearchaeota archaeon]|nr:hypothetical protein [Candidatus Woesearchaeota archaeon]